MILDSQFFQLATTWLAFSLMICAFAWASGKWWRAVLLPLAAVAVAVALWVPTGAPRFTHIPKGKYEVLWADIQVDKAIYVLLTNGSLPVYYVLPYTESEANDLQSAINEGGEGGTVKAEVNGKGGERYDGKPPVTGNPPKE